MRTFSIWMILSAHRLMSGRKKLLKVSLEPLVLPCWPRCWSWYRQEVRKASFSTSPQLMAWFRSDHNPNAGTKFQPALEPDDGDWTSTDWSQWNFPDPLNYLAVSLEDCVNLGLAKPSYARKNAYSYVHFAICVANDDLDCDSWLPDAALLAIDGAAWQQSVVADYRAAQCPWNVFLNLGRTTWVKKLNYNWP